MDEGTLIMTGLDKNIILKSIEVLLIQSKRISPKVVDDYNSESVSLKVVRVILSYTNYINNFIWKKDVSSKSF